MNDLTRNLGCHRTIATLLANRGITAADQARAFLHPSLRDLHPPDGVMGLKEAVKRLYRAITNREKILIFGDYDVDGVTATAILHEFLQATGANVSCYIPHRIREGYSLQIRHITELARPHGIDLIVTVDCGSTSHEAVDAAHQVGIDVIITDHHEMKSAPPRALAIINPKRPDDPSGFEYLAGVGVAFYLLAGLRKYMRAKGFWADRLEPNLKSMFDLVALGTVADVVPLIAANRIITRHGLEMIRSGRRPGLDALIRVSGLQKTTVDADALAFYLAPRLNAAGRMSHASLALSLLTSASATDAEPLAEQLQQLNTARQQVEKSILDNIQARFFSDPHLLERPALVLAQPGWHAGVLGIVASRLAKQYHRPVVLISIDGDTGLGSARSIPGLNLYTALAQCQNDLIGFGGHAMAAGLRIRTTQIAVFEKAFAAVMQRASQDIDLTPSITIDCELEFKAICADLIDALSLLQPFGTASPKPLFMARNVHVQSSQLIGTNHRRMRLSQTSSNQLTALDAIQFNVDPQQSLPDRFGRIAFELQWNRWNGGCRPQLVIAAMQP